MSLCRATLIAAVLLGFVAQAQEFRAGEKLKGAHADIMILQENPKSAWTIAVYSHDKDADEFLAEIFYRQEIPMPEKTLNLTRVETLHGPALAGTMCAADRNTAIPLAQVEKIKIRLFRSTVESEFRRGK